MALLPTRESLEEMERQAQFITKIGTSRDELDNPILEATNPDTDVTLPTLEGIALKFDASIAALGWNNLGEFSTLPTSTIPNDVLVFEGAFWVTTEPLPYTPTGISPLVAPEAGKWAVAVTSELLGIARSLNVLNTAVQYTTYEGVLDAVRYLYDAVAQKTWSVPTLNGTGEIITSVNGSDLVTSGGSYVMSSYVPSRDKTYYNTKEFGASSTKTATENRIALQAAFNYLVPGDELFNSIECDISNATGNGVGLVAQRADAVLNNTLFAIECATDNITFTNRGKLTATSALDDLIRLTGEDVLVRGKGQFIGNGEILETNSGDPLINWLPALVKVYGVGSLCTEFTCVHPTTVGVYMRGSEIDCDHIRVKGGATTHGTGTILFGIKSGHSSIAYVDNSVTHCKVVAFEGKAVYSGIFTTSADSDFSHNKFHDLLEHGIYSYGSGCTIIANIMSRIATATAIQSFGEYLTVTNNVIKNSATGGIAMFRASLMRTHFTLLKQ